MAGLSLPKFLCLFGRHQLPPAFWISPNAGEEKKSSSAGLMPPVHGGLVLPDLSGPGKFPPNRVGNNCLRSKHLRAGRNGWDETGVLRYNGNFSGLRNLANFAKRTQVLMILRQARSKAAASCKDCYLELNSVKKRSNALGRKPSAWGAGLSTAGCLPRDGVGSLAGGSS